MLPYNARARAHTRAFIKLPRVFDLREVNEKRDTKCLESVKTGIRVSGAREKEKREEIFCALLSFADRSLIDVVRSFRRVNCDFDRPP